MDTPGITELRYIGLAVPDFDTERRFIREHWGLEEVAAEEGAAYFAAAGSPEPFIIRLRQGEDRRTDLIAFAAKDAAAIDTLHGRLKDEGVRIISAPAPLSTPGGGYGFRFFDPDGRAIEVSSDVAPRPFRKLNPGESIPVAISHVVLHAPDPAAAVAFYEDKLGFRLSDQLADFMFFLRCNEWHHRLAFLKGPPALNHIAFAMQGMDEMMRGLGRLLPTEAKLVWGPGRHTAGDNTFAYFLTPGGNNFEYTAELERVDEDWKATVYKLVPEITDQWGTGRIHEGLGPHRVVDPDPGLWRTPPF